MPSPARLLLSLLLAFAPACSKSPEQEEAAAMALHRPAATARIAALKQAAASMAAVPRLAADTLSLRGAKVTLGEARTYETINAGLLYEEDLADLDSPHTKEPWPMPASDVYRTAAALLQGGGFVATHQKGRVLANGAAARYAVMMRTLERVAPTVDEAAKTFTKGRQAGEVHVFDLDSGAHLGGFRVDATNDDRVQARGISDLTDVQKELAINLQVAIATGLAKFAQ